MTSLGRRLSLQTKLFLSILVLIAIAAVFGYMFINYSVREAFSTFTVRSFTMQDRLLSQVIVDYYNRTGSFDGVVDFLEESSVDVPLLLVDPDGVVVYPGDWNESEHKLSDEDLSRGQGIILPDGERWTLVPYRVNPEHAELERVFLARIRQSLWFAGLVTAAAGLLIAILFRRQVTRPLRRLDAATRRLAQGNLRERVRVESNDEFGRLAASFNDMAESLETSEEVKKRMIADIAHELRTPLTAVRSALEGLRDGLIEPSPATLAALHDKILLTTRLVRDLHQLALTDAGRLSIHPSPCEIKDLVDSIAETIGVQLEDVKVRLDQQIDSELPAVHADRQRIEQVLLNLLANAIRHTPEEGSISVSATRSDHEVLISVCDTGPGMNDADLIRAFDRFYRADQARGADGSAGLGLSIAKALVEAHGGRIWAENRPSGGACFRFTLPAVAAEGRLEAAPNAAT